MKKVFTLGQGLNAYDKQGFRSFHTPGHKGKRKFFQGISFPDHDLTELPGLDVLHAPSGIIAEAQRRTAEIFRADQSYFLVNGGTAGNQAMLLALEGTESIPGPILVSRESHRSVMAGFILSGSKPEYVNPIIHPDFNLPLGIDLSSVTKHWGHISACHFTYPSYYGTTIDLGTILNQRNARFPSLPVLVDQAHGSHYLHSLFPPSALDLGADLVLNSAHKTLSALTQAAILHVKGNNISRRRLKQSLELLQTSSPSYLLMASLERAVEFALEPEPWEALREEVEKLYRKAGRILRILTPEDNLTYGIKEVDWTKILVNTRPLGISAPQCVEHLRTKFKLEPELWDEENILFLLGIGNSREDIQVLAAGLESLAFLEVNEVSRLSARENGYIQTGGFSFPPQKLTPREAFLAKKRQIPVSKSVGQIAGETISPYPPGIPLVVMGEEITYDIIEALKSNAEGHWQGWDTSMQDLIWIIEEE